MKYNTGATDHYSRHAAKVLQTKLKHCMQNELRDKFSPIKRTVVLPYTSVMAAKHSSEKKHHFVAIITAAHYFKQESRL